MAWIESHQSLGGHIKLRRLARALNIPKAQAIGHLHYLWWWALDGAPDGDITTLSNDEIAELADWTGDSDVFVTALTDCGWIEKDRKIHDWNEYAGKLLEFRRRDRERKRDVRRKSDGNTTDVHGMSVVPYRTVPNQPTVPTNKDSGECPPDGGLKVTQMTVEESKSTRVKFTPPTLPEVKLHFSKIGLPEDEAEAFIAHHAQRHWIPRGSTRQMTSWHHAATTWKLNWKNGSFRPAHPKNTSTPEEQFLLQQANEL